MAATRSKAFAWLQLVRLPNLLTVPGDPVAGYCLAAGVGLPGRACWLAASAAVLLYAAGLLLNDLADLPADRAERPARPLPAGLVAPGPVWAAAVLLALGGGALACLASSASGWVALALAVLVAAYDFKLKASAVAGPLAMGGCRGLSVLLGALAAPSPAGLALAGLGAGLTGFYIAAVTRVARNEMSQEPPGAWRWAPAGALAAGAAGLAGCQGWPPYALALVPAWALALRAGQQATGRSLPLPRVIGYWIRALIFIQIGQVCLGARGSSWAMVICLAGIGLWVCNRWLGRLFYAS